MNIQKLIRESVKKTLAEVGKQNYLGIFIHMNPSDRRTIRYWNVRDEGNEVIINLYSTLVGQGMLEFITAFVEKHMGAFRLSPQDGLICIEMKIRAPK